MRPPYDGPQAHAAQVVEERRRVDLALRQRVQQPAPNLPGNKRDRYAIGASMTSDSPGLYGVGATGGGTLSTATVHPDYDPVKCRIVIHLPGTYVFTAALSATNTNFNAYETFTMGGGDMDVSALLDHGREFLSDVVVGVRFDVVATTCHGIVKTTEMDDYVDLVVDGSWDADAGFPIPNFSGSLTIVKVA